MTSGAINANPVDRAQADDLQDATPEFASSEVWEPQAGKPANEIEEEIRELTEGCDALVVFWGIVEPQWVVRQLKQVSKYAAARPAPARRMNGPTSKTSKTSKKWKVESGK